MPELLRVKNLRTQFNTEGGIVKAVDSISYYIDEQEIVGLVGESGCGKSVSQLSVMQLINTPGKIVGGEVIFEGRDLLTYKAHGPEMRAIRGAKIAMVFQEPMTSLNPVLTISQQLTEMLMLHLKMNHDSARIRAAELLHLVGIPSAESRLDDYPHQFSGGMRQRVMIAMALSCNPKMLIADEPTTALDVTTQAQLLELMASMVKQFHTSLVIVTHNLGVVARYAHRIYIMYAGHIVETGTTKEIFGNPLHPYTVGLLKSVPRLDEPEGTQLVPIEGMLGSLINLPPVCAFLPRCSCKSEKCFQEPCSQLISIPGAYGEHYVACHVVLTAGRGLANGSRK
jgi:peptide/nickel transport system ATP-binding protein